MSGRVLIYGANGFSGGQIAERLADLGDTVVLAGRDAPRVGLIAERLGRSMRTFGLEERDAIDGALGGISLVLNAAGPYRRTAAPMMAACLRTGADYLDLTGEWPVFAAAMAASSAARRAGVMLMPGAGVAIAVTDCLLAVAAERAPEAVKLRLALSRPHQLSRGSVETMLGLFDDHALIRRDGAVERVAAGHCARDFDFGDGPRRATFFSWPDVVTGQFTTGVANIEAFCEAGWATRTAYRMAGTIAPFSPDFVRRAASAWPDRPSVRSLETAGYSVVAEAEDRWRRTSGVRIRIRDGYSTTTETANAIVRRVLAGHRRPGFQTPGKLFGGRLLHDLGYETSDLMAA